ncbi:hypothetical protein SOVF_135630 [Spinacia oleracea]|uniref:Uncharacterized protein n=1 Tax=Spinacia oleracea TaxID=3562 RepID=A0A9R0JDW5_SPIOL|nr:uncharacterized protein LOC110804082 [Spinacia oleracea]KNA11393.1 hypothetical protein SOVF_135630 [Spinacia oleracea]
MMSTQNQAGHGVIQSSIALLQERFKELQRVKEMREKKELLTIFSDNNLINTPNNYGTPISNNDGDVVDVDNDDNDDELQIFLPPNYYYTGRKPSSYSSSSSSLSSSSLSSLLLSHNNNNNHNYRSSNNNLNEISLSLWPSSTMSTYNNASSTTSTTAVAAAAAAAEHIRRAKIEAPMSTMSVSRTSSCVSSVYKFEDIHVSDVDTTLHL